MKSWITRVVALTAAFGLASTLGALAANLSLDQGTQITGSVQQELNSKTAQNGERFTVVTQNGSTISGHLSDVVHSSITHKAHMTLNFDTIEFVDGTSAPLSAKLVSVQEKKSVNVARAAGTVIVGNILGNYLGKHLGTNLGGLAGVVGGAVVAANNSTDLVVPKDAQVTVELTQPLIVRPQSRAAQ